VAEVKFRRAFFLVFTIGAALHFSCRERNLATVSDTPAQPSSLPCASDCKCPTDSFDCSLENGVPTCVSDNGPKKAACSSNPPSLPGNY
jgi:hypothetical protein